MRTARRLPLLVAAGSAFWLALAGLVWWQWPKADAPMDLSEAALADIEPASGGGEPSEDGAHGSSAEGGKDAAEALPVVTVGNLTITTSKARADTAVKELMPKGLLDASSQMELQRTFKFTPYAHNPTRGGGQTPKVMLIEFSDLACGQCRKDMSAADTAYDAHKDEVRQVAIHLPLARYSDTNLLAFYGKVAQRGGKYWEYRDILVKKGTDAKSDAAPADEAGTEAEGFAALQAAGLDEAQVRRWVTREARRYYRELDADAALARALGMDQPPHFYVNGVHVGEQGIPRERLGDTVTWMLLRNQYQLDTTPAPVFKGGQRH